MATEVELAQQLGELKAKVESNANGSSRMWDAMTKQNEAIQRIERSVERLGDAVSRIAEDRADLQLFKREITAAFQSLDKQIKEEMELLKDDLIRRKGSMDVIIAIVKTSPIWGVLCGLAYAGYVAVTGDGSISGAKP